MTKFTPGMRVLIRDEEWIVKKVDSNSNGGKTVNVIGISSLVKDREAIFLDSIDDIEEVRAEETKLVVDNSPQFVKSKLFIESKLRNRVPMDHDKLCIGHKAAMNAVPYQLDPALIALGKTRQRILIADAVGLGKTLEAGVLMSELIARGKGKRILVVTVKSMMTQFQKEMWNRFTISLERLDSAGIQKIRNKIPSNHNPFYYYDKVIISMDTLKRDVEYRVHLENSHWDIIVIDEAHNVARRGEKQAQRARLASLLSEKSDALIMLSATPHDGKPRSFASLMNMLDATAIANEDEYTKEEIQELCVRRFKKDIQSQVESAFKERKLYIEREDLSLIEEEAYDFFANMQLNTLDKRSNASQLFKTTLEKSLLSSPAACIATIKNRLLKIEKLSNVELDKDINNLTQLKVMLENISKKDFSKYKHLIELIKSANYSWRVNNTKDRIVIFTERIETMKFLSQNLTADLNMPKGSVQTLFGGMSDIEQQEIVDNFGRNDAPIRILVASDVASEGINLHYLSHRLIHFDIPWSLMVFQQRNGRIDRYGQERTPDIRYLVSRSVNEKIKGDLRILEILITKEEQAVKNIGDPAALMNLYDQELEERVTAEAIENRSADELEEKLTIAQAQPDLLSLMLAGLNEPVLKKMNNTIDMFTMYSDYDYLKMGLNYLAERERFKFEETDSFKGLSISLTDELKKRLATNIPLDAMPKNDVLVLTSDKSVVEEEIVKGRKEKMEEKSWAKIQYLWSLHPIFDWLNDKSKTIFKRREAPVMHLPGVIGDNEVLFIVSGLIPNRKSQPIINEWFGLLYNDKKLIQVLNIDDLFEKTKVINSGISNRGELDEEKCREYEALLSNVIDNTKRLISDKYKEYNAYYDPKLQEEMDKLESLKGKHYEQLSFLKTEIKIDEKKRKIDDTFAHFLKWVEDTMILEKEPYIEIISVVVGG